MKIKLTKKEYAFIEKELGYTKNDIAQFTEEQWDSFYDEVCEIEECEAFDADEDAEELSDRGEMAAAIVTKYSLYLMELRGDGE